MASSPTPQATLRQRNVGASTKKTKDGVTSDVELDKLVKAATVKSAKGSELDFKAVFVIITALAFLTRFWGISHPNEVVFDEVHFGKVHTLAPLTVSLSLPLTFACHSSPRTTSRKPISSMCTLRSASSSSPLWAGSWATMATSTSRTSATPTS
jgi:hypothetical protein